MNQDAPDQTLQHGHPAMTQPTPILLDKILTLLAPLFLVATHGDVDLARETVRATLASYDACTDAELRLAALVVAFGFGALDALSKAANRDLSLDQVMDLRDNATALSQAGDRSQVMLDRLRKQRPADPAPDPEPAALPASVEIDDLLAFARKPAQAAPVSAPQPRASEKARQQQEFLTQRARPAAGRPTLH